MTAPVLKSAIIGGVSSISTIEAVKRDILNLAKNCLTIGILLKYITP